ncbi:uncharacterized protein N7469_000551 [Penicillium citrinum]|uniref:BZIP domain-containing protein n=1 Tax=Penicillium citrinum TaxID=5077 RepID=A0A9W9PCZ6_PENCI|nr:uncharacterized protein N7469_000551 [Penicillium citrinum]KAJ5242224.1 hypothetical protein N7469_000551 [Penicillium citrinum]
MHGIFIFHLFATSLPKQYAKALSQDYKDARRYNASPNSTGRKRLRDRKAQQTLRDKRERRIRGLEEKIALCERHHGNTGVHYVKNLRSQNEKLRMGLESLRNILHSLDDDAWSTPKERCRQHRGTGATGIYSAASPLFSADTEGLTCYACMVPDSDERNHHYPLLSWLSRPDLINTCPYQPPPLALPYGTRRNWLAVEIHRSIRLRAIRDSECLAIGWLAYNYSKWRVSPSAGFFARLTTTTFQQPTLPQLQHGHPVGIDLLTWPQLR